MSNQRSRLSVPLILSLSAALFAPGAGDAQTVRGTLLDAQSGALIPVGLVLMYTEAGDSITATVGDLAGQFAISSPDPGSFVLIASALGYRETRAGVFELGPDGEITVEYRLQPEPLAIDAIVVSLDRPTTMHHLVRNGFVRRFQQGLGVFVTPFEIEKAIASSTEQLLQGRPGIRVRPVSEGAFAPAPHLGDVVQIQVPGGWCLPTLYVDGIRVPYSPEGGHTLSGYVNILQVEAIEVYRRPAEMPVEYGRLPETCGVVVVWSKLGLAPGQAPQRASVPGAVGTGEYRGEEEIFALPEVDESGPPPERGETIRLELSPEMTLSLGSPWQGTFLRAEDEAIVVMDPLASNQRILPRQAIEVIQVERMRDSSHAWKRASLWGGTAALFTWGGLAVLCAWSECNAGDVSTVLPSVAVGGLVFFAIRHQGPGTHWVATTLPEVR